MKILPPWSPAVACTRWLELCCLSDCLQVPSRAMETALDKQEHEQMFFSESTKVLSTGSFVW